MRKTPTSARMRRLLADESGNVLMIMALSMIPVLSIVGAGVDYGRAASAENQMNAYADAAALTGVTKTEVQNTVNPASCYSSTPTAANCTGTLQAYNDVLNQFNAQASHVNNASYTSASDVTVKVTDDNGIYTTVYQTVGGTPTFSYSLDSTSSGKTSLTRTVQVQYAATVNNIFMSIAGVPSTQIGGKSVSTESVAPNIDFYLAMDTSPSMAFPTTTAGINYLQNAVGCSFACHSYDIARNGSAVTDNSNTKINKINGGSKYLSTTNYINGSQTTTFNGNVTIIDAQGSMEDSSGRIYNSSGKYADTYWLTQNQGLTLRIDAERQAAQSLVSTALTTATSNNVNYRMGMYTFNMAGNFQTIQSLTAISTSSQSSLVTAAGNIQLQLMYGSGGTVTQGGSDTFWVTSYADMLTQMASVLPTKPGNGTSAQGDTPQAVLFIITDGISDEQSSPIGAAYSLGSDRTRSAMVQYHINQCNAIKNRGIRIAILYTQYLPSAITQDGSQGAYVSGFLTPPDQAATALAQCASPNLMYTVTTNQDISAALSNLFKQAVSTATLLQ